MINTIILNEDIFESRKYLEILSIEYENLKVTNIAINMEEAKKIILNSFPDIIIVCDDSFNIKQILNENFYSPLIIYSNNIQSLLKHHSEIDKMCKQKNKNTKKQQTEYEKFNKLTKQIYKKLVSLNFRTNMKGTMLLAECISYTYIHEDEDILKCLGRNLYPVIGAKHKSTGEAVKWDVIKSINTMYKENLEQKPEIINNFLNLEIPMKSTPKFFITHFIQALR